MRLRLLSALAVLSIAVPFAAHAAALPFFGPIIPPAYANCPAGWGLIMTVVNNIITVLLSFAIVFIAPIMIAYAGFLLVVNPVNASGKERAKSILQNTIIGIIIALAGWLIVDAIMAVLYDSGRVGENWYALVTSNGDACLRIAEEFAPPAPPVTVPPISVVPPTVPTGEQAIRDLLKQYGISVNKSACTPEQMAGPACGTSPGPSCTNVAGMQPATVQQVINVANACGGRPGFNVCGLVVTGGTEPGHACGPTSHSAGYKVDLGINSALDTYLKGWLGQPTSVRGGDSGGPVRNDSCGNEYVQESNHWDIKVKTACGTVTPPPNNPTPRTWPPSTQTFQYFGNAIRVNNVASGQENFFAFNFAAGQGTTLAAVAYQIPGTPDGTDTITVYGPNDSIVAGPESCSTFYCIARVNNAAPGLYHVIVVQTFSATPPNPSVGAFGANMSL